MNPRLLLLSFIAMLFLPTGAHAQAEPAATVTANEAIFWFPVLNTNPAFEPGNYSATVHIRLFGDPYAIEYTCERNDTGSFDTLIRDGSSTFARDDSLAHNSNPVTLHVTAEPAGGGLRLRLQDRKWVSMIMGARPDSLVMDLWWTRPSIAIRHPEDTVDAANRWARPVRVDYRVPRSTLRLSRTEYRANYAQQRRFLSTTFPARKLIATLLLFSNGDSVVFYDVSGKRIEEGPYRTYVPAVHRQSIATRKMTSFRMMTSFSLCGEHLFYGDVSLFDQTAKGVLDTIFAGAEEGDFGIYYTGQWVDPTGRFMTVVGGNGTGWSFLWDIDHARSMRELPGYGDYRAVWSEDGSGVSHEGAWYSATSNERTDLDENDDALNDGKIYSLTTTGVTMRRLGDEPSSAVTIAAVDTSPGQDEFDWSRILGFVDGNVLVRIGSRVLVCNEGGIVREIDAGPAFTRSVVSLQYIFKPR
ncbi:MAG TPA: hypothetical protein VJS69_01550 [Candidatus Krumholzibacteria bacterium]|nr:hypothetical protein [Candidatus Krumholzibacteria bacterium]